MVDIQTQSASGRCHEVPCTVANARLQTDGFELVKAVLESAECNRASQSVDQTDCSAAGTRRMLDHQWCQELATYLKHHRGLNRRLPPEAVAIQCTLFEKSESNNWLVGLHQDLSVCVAKKVSAQGWRSWSEKEGLIFVQPPRPVLVELVAVRIHLDDCPISAGALRVIAKSHKQGESGAIPPQNVAATYVPMQRGDALLLRPLLLHASSKASIPSRRRVLHFLFAPKRLSSLMEGALSWRWTV